MVSTGLLTVEDLLKLPDPKEGHNELHHGEAVVMPPPKKEHQKLQDCLQGLLKRLLGGRYVVYMEMAFRPAPEHELWLADVGCVSRERFEATAGNEYLMGSPELVIEVQSPSNTVDEFNDKMSICMANSCISFWTVDGKRNSVSVSDGNITRHYGMGDRISCSLFRTDVRVEEVFAADRA